MKGPKAKPCASCGGFIQEGVIVHGDGCTRTRIKMTVAQLLERLSSVERPCNQARVRIVRGGEAWEMDEDTLAALSDIVDDAHMDLHWVRDEIEARQITAETP